MNAAFFSLASALRAGASAGLARLVPQWGLRDANGKELALFDTFISMDARAENKVTQNPVEEGSFASYNKTATPTRLNVLLARTAAPALRAAILTRLDELAEGTELVSVVTPDRTFLGYTLAGYDYSYSADKGIDRLAVSLTLEEVREVEAEYGSEQLPPKKCKNPSSSSTQDAGKQQGSEPKPRTKSTLKKGLDWGRGK